MRYDLAELKNLQVQILRKVKSDGTVDNVNRSVPNLEEITPVRRYDSPVGGVGARQFPSSQNRNGNGRAMPSHIWDEDPSRSYFHQPSNWEEFKKNEGSRPIFERFAKIEKPSTAKYEWTVYRRSHSPTGRGDSRSDGPSRIDSNRERDKERDSRVPFDALKYEALDAHEKRSHSYSRSGGDDQRQAIDRRRDDSDSHYPQPDFRNQPPQKSRSSESANNFRGRINERRSDHNPKYDERERDRNKERPRERERERTDYQPSRRPIQDRRSPGASNRRPSDRDQEFDRHRGDKEQWERERGREIDVDRRRRPKSRERDDDRREPRPREGREEGRPPRRTDDRSEHRSNKHSDYPQDEGEEEEYEAGPPGPAPHHLRGARGRVGWGRGGIMLRGAPRGAMRGAPMMRPLAPFPPHQPFFPPPVRPMPPIMPMRGYPPRFHHPPFFRPFFM
ncbi:zinc finger CCCH domain-containing protein 13 isoform X2 [Nilaparvata lugens]|uniref:zinc finger CCCH domain-containing protein 13 isoform X2 n=1 Tax=Nilaparvata lugens TaxID=108931 RepID=UPI00193E25CE|nr:zinc finger CCCH domain-containing protein 13 isoform X2 [Nilaparvata lugens]